MRNGSEADVDACLVMSINAAEALWGLDDCRQGFVVSRHIASDVCRENPNVTPGSRHKRSPPIQSDSRM